MAKHIVVKHISTLLAGCSCITFIAIVILIVVIVLKRKKQKEFLSFLKTKASTPSGDTSTLPTPSVEPELELPTIDNIDEKEGFFITSQPAKV